MVRKLSLSLILVCGIVSLRSQGIDLPRKSPLASVSLRIGLTDVQISYSSPGVNGRTIWGDLVPFDSVWRAGANEPTTISFSSDVEVEGKTLPKGTYNLLFIPGKEYWTVIFNTQLDLQGISNYDALQDKLHVIVRPTNSAITEERLQYSITEQGFDKGYIRLSWEKLRLFLRIKTDFMMLSEASINQALDTSSEVNRWRLHLIAAEFYEEQRFVDKAIAQLDLSMAIKTNSENLWKKALLYATKESYELAIAAGQAAKSIGNTDEDDVYYSLNAIENDALVEVWRQKIEKE